MFDPSELQAEIRPILAWAWIMRHGSLTCAMDAAEEFLSAQMDSFICAKPVDAEAVAGVEKLLRDLEYVHHEQGRTGQPISYEFVSLVLGPEGQRSRADRQIEK